MGTDRPHVVRQAIHCCRNFGTVSIVGVYGGYLDKIPMGSAINRGLTFRMAQTPVQHYLPKLLKLVEEGRIDPSFVITDRASLEDGPALYKKFPGQGKRLYQGRDEAVVFFATLLLRVPGRSSFSTQSSAISVRASRRALLVIVEKREHGPALPPPFVHDRPSFHPTNAVARVVYDSPIPKG